MKLIALNKRLVATILSVMMLCTIFVYTRAKEIGVNANQGKTTEVKDEKKQNTNTDINNSSVGVNKDIIANGTSNEKPKTELEKVKDVIGDPVEENNRPDIPEKKVKFRNSKFKLHVKAVDATTNEELKGVEAKLTVVKYATFEADYGETPKIEDVTYDIITPQNISIEVKDSNINAKCIVTGAPAGYAINNAKAEWGLGQGHMLIGAEDELDFIIKLVPEKADKGPKFEIPSAKVSTGTQTDLTAKDIAAMQEKIKSLQKELETCKTDDSEKLKEIQKLKEQLQEAKNQIESISRDKTKSDSEKQKAIDELQEKLKGLEQKIRDLSAENTLLKETIKSLQEKIKSLQKELETCKTDDSEKLKEIQKLKEQLQEAKNQIESINRDKTKSDSEKQKAIDELQEKLKGLEQKIRDLSAENTLLKETIKSLQEKIKSLQKELETCKTDDKEKLKEIQQLKEQLQEMQNRLKKLEEEKLTSEQKGKEVEQLKAKIAELENIIKKLNKKTDVISESTQTQYTVKVIYRYKDGKLYKDYLMSFDKSYKVDASDLEMLPDEMEFTDDFHFYEVKGDGKDQIVRIVAKKTADKAIQTNLDNREKQLDEYQKLFDKLSKDNVKDKEEIEKLKSGIKDLQNKLQDDETLFKNRKNEINKPEREYLEKRLQTGKEKLQNLSKQVREWSQSSTKSGTETNNINSEKKENNTEKSDDNAAYSADARQFITFKTKSGKTFHLIINHDEKGENVQLLTEVNEDDLLNMVEKKKEVKPVEPKPVVTVEKKEEKPVKEEEASNLGMYLLIGLIAVSGVGGLLYYKKMKAKEAAELKEFDNEETEDIDYEDDLMAENEKEETAAVSQESQEE